MHRRQPALAAWCLAWLVASCHARQHLPSRQACLEQAEVEIRRTPDKDDLVVTTSRQFKRDLADYFCHPRWQGAAAVEVGIYQGHSTAVLASIFETVIAVDANSSYLQDSASWNQGRSNVVYFQFHTGKQDWAGLSANSNIKVVMIDGDHYYKQVFVDALNAVSFFEQAEVFVFDDYAYEEGVRKAVAELVEARLLRSCVGIGHGRRSGQFRHPDFAQALNGSEGRLCQRGLRGLEASAVAQQMMKTFQMQVPYFLYDYPLDRLLRSVGLLQFQQSEESKRATWSGVAGQIWHLAVETVTRPAGSVAAGVFTLRMEIPGQQKMFDVIFNEARTAFFISDPATGTASWWGLRMDKVMEPFQSANEDFHVELGVSG